MTMYDDSRDEERTLHGNTPDDGRRDALRAYFSSLGWGTGVHAGLVFDFLRRAAAASRGGAILDAGAGHQRYRPFFEGSHYIAQEHPVAGAANKGIVDYDILCDVRRIPLRDDSVDAVLSTSSLEHIEFPDAFFAEALRVLRPGGTLFVQVPFVYPEHEVPYDFQRPTRYGLERWYRHAGFDRIEVVPASSSIYAATAFLKTAMFEGMRNPARLPGLGGRLRALADPRLPARALLYLLAVAPLAKLLNLLLDRRPGPDAIFPIGWIAQGRKPGDAGTSAAHATPKADFLRERMLPDGTFELRDGVIRPRG